MTVIAWDGTTLAADRRCTNYGIVYPVRKVFRVGDGLVGMNGDAKHVGAFLAWLERGAIAAEYPYTPKDDGHCYAVVIRRESGRPICELYEGTPYPYRVERPFHASGSGRDFAIAAMHLGCDAKRAVEVACEYESGCGNGIDTLTFEQNP